MPLQQIQRRGRQDKMTKAAVQLLLEVEMIERISEMRMVEMRIYAKHLQKDGLADAAKLLGKAGALAKPFGISRCGWLRGEGRVECIRDAVGVGREYSRIVDFARDPSLHKGDVLVGGQLDRFIPTVEPGVGVITDIMSARWSFVRLCRNDTYGPALILGQVVGLQMLAPPSSFS